jgi:hypothetical protein
MRIAVLFLCLPVAACSVGEFGVSDSGSGTACVDRITPPSVAHLHKDDGTAHAGMTCVSANCHLAAALGTDAPAYQFGGTVYKPGGMKVPSAGVTVRVKGKSGMVVTGVTDDAGNFSIPGNALPDPFPAQVTATACPTVTPMVAALVAGGGNCNSTDCHGGSQGVITVADQ